MQLAWWLCNLILMAGGEVKTAYLCASVLAEDLEKRAAKDGNAPNSTERDARER